MVDNKAALETIESGISVHVENAYKNELGGERLASNAKAAVEYEHAIGSREAIKAYPKAILWCLAVSMCVIMEGYDTILIGNFYAYPEFARKYGQQVITDDGLEYQLTAPGKPVSVMPLVSALSLVHFSTAILLRNSVKCACSSDH